MIKRITLILTVAVLMLSLCACKKPDNSKNGGAVLPENAAIYFIG